MRSTIIVAMVAVWAGVSAHPSFSQSCDPVRGVPCAAQSTIDPLMFGNTSGNPMYHYPSPTCGCPPVAGYRVTVRDYQGTPVEHAHIRVRFATASFKALTVQTGMTANCAGKYLETTAGTTGTGFITFQPRFGGDAALFAQEIEILAVTATHVVSLGYVQGRTVDYDKNGSCGLGDLSAFSGYYLAGDLRADFDNSFSITVQDLSLFSAEFNASVVSPPCP